LKIIDDAITTDVFRKSNNTCQRPGRLSPRAARHERKRHEKR
jgi:hypothetical protein